MAAEATGFEAGFELQFCTRQGVAGPVLQHFLALAAQQDLS